MAQTTTSTGHTNTKHAQGPTGSVIKAEKATCTAEGIKAFCEHTGAKEGEKAGAKEGAGAAPKNGAGPHAAHAQSAPPKPAPAAAHKPGEAGHPEGGEDGRRFAKEEAEAPPPASPKPGQPKPPPSKPAAKSLVLQLVPTAPEDKETGGKVKAGEHVTLAPGSTEVGPVKHVAGTPGKGDLVTILANKKGTASKCPEWIITDHGTGKNAAKKEAKSGTPLKYTFLPPDAAELARHIVQNPLYKMGWLDAVSPRRYTVVCTSPFPPQPAHQAPAGHPQAPAGHPQAPAGHPQAPAGHPQAPAGHPQVNHSRPAPGARPPQAPAAHQAPPQPPGEHHTLEVAVYPSDKWTLKLTSDKSKHQPTWLRTLNELKEGLEEAIAHASELAHDRNALIPKAELKLLDGDLSLSNFWEEKEASNLVQWTAELEGTVTIIDFTLTFGIDVAKFIKAAENLTEATKVAGKAVRKFEEHFEAATGLKAEVSLSFIVSIKFDVGGKAIWHKAPHSRLTANVNDLHAKLTGGLGLSGELTVERIRGNTDQVLVKFTGSGTSEMTLTTSPRLGDTPQDKGNLWLDNTFGWNPLNIHLKVEANKDNIPKGGQLPTKPGAAPPAGKPGKPIPILPSVDVDWSGELFKVIKDRPLKSLNLTTLTWGPPHALENPVTPTPPKLPSNLTPAVKPSKPAPIP